jgi:cytochrome P450
MTGGPVSPWATHRHPRHWKQPDRFDPDRFTPERPAGHQGGAAAR